MRKLGATVMFLVAAFMLLGFSLSTADVSRGVTVFSIMLTVVLPAGVGVALLRGGAGNNDARMKQLRLQTIDAEILRLATARGGQLTAVDITIALGLNDADVKESLEGMVRREAADLDVTDDGALVYTFRDVKHGEGNYGARGFLDA